MQSAGSLIFSKLKLKLTNNMTRKTSRSDLLFLLLAFEIFVTISVTAQRTPVSIKVGLVVNIDDYGRMGLTCINMALSDFYAKHSHYRTRLALVVRDSHGDAVLAAAAVVDLLKNVKVQAIIGPEYSSEASFIISLGRKAQVPIITYSATSPSLSSFRSPYFIRATLDDSSQVHAIGAIVKSYGWQEVVLIYEDNVFGEGIVPLLSGALENVNARIPYKSVLPSPATDDQILAELYKLKSMHTRVFIVHVLRALGSRLFTKAKELGMMSGDYVWIITDGMAYELNIIDPLVLKSMLGVVGVKPYISQTENLKSFKTRYKMKDQENNPKVATPEVIIFGLWAYDVAVALAMSVENAGIGSNLTFVEANIFNNSTDLESIGTSVAGPMLIKSLLSTSFIGLSGTFNLTDGQLQSPPYEIINVVGSGNQVVGYWTKENGIVRDLKSISEINRYSTDKSNFGSTIWPGNRTFPGKGWVIPINGKKLRVGVPVKEGFFEFVKVTWNSDSSTTVEGYCIKIFDEVMNSLPYGVSYEYIPFATPDRKTAGTYDDLVQQVYLGNFDAVAGDITILANRSHDVDFTLPYLDSGISMVVPFVHDKRKNGWIFFNPLTQELWLMILGSFLVMGVLIWNLERRTNEDFKGTGWYQFFMVFWFPFSTMVFAHKEKIVTNPAKFVLMVWFFVVLVLTQSYTANLASMLTVQRSQPTVTEIDYLIQNKLSVGFKNGSFVHEFLRRKNFDVDRLVAFHSPKEMDELFQKGSENGGIAAAFDEIPYINHFLLKYCSNYTMVGPIYKADGFGFVFPKGSPLVPDVSRAVLNITEGKTIRKSKCPNSSSFASTEDSLELANFKGLFIITATAGLISLFWDVIKQFSKDAYNNPVETDSMKINELLELVRRMSPGLRKLHRSEHHVGLLEMEPV